MSQGCGGAIFLGRARPRWKLMPENPYLLVLVAGEYLGYEGLQTGMAAVAGARQTLAVGGAAEPGSGTREYED